MHLIFKGPIFAGFITGKTETSGPVITDITNHEPDTLDAGITQAIEPSVRYTFLSINYKSHVCLTVLQFKF